MTQAKISLSIDGVQTVVGGMKQVGDRVKDVANSLSSLTAIGGSISLGAFAGMIKSSIDAADNLNDLSKKTSLAVDTLAGLKLAAEQSGADLDGIAKAVNKLTVNMGKEAEKFAKLGVTAKDPIEAFKQLADVFSAVEDPQMRAALGSEALGKSWETAAPLLAEGGTKIGEMVDKGKRLSGVTQDMADNADKLNDQLAEMKALSASLGTKLAAEMLPALVSVTGAVKIAYEEQGKLAAAWVAMGALGAFLFTDEFSSATEKIKKLREELNKLEEQKRQNDAAPFVGIIPRLLFGESDVEGRIASVKGQIEALQKTLEKPTAPAVDPEIERAKARAKAENERRVAAFIAGQEAAKSAAAAAKRELDEQAKLLAKLAGVNGDYMEQLTRLQAIRAKGRITETEYIEAVKELIALQPASKKIIDEQIKQAKELADARTDLRRKEQDAIDDYFQSQTQGYNDAVRASGEALKAAQAEYTQLGMNKSQIAEINLLTLQSEQAKYREGSAGYQSLQLQIEKQRELIGVLKQTDDAIQWRSMFESIDRTAHDTFVSIFDSGKNAFDRLRDALKNGLLDLLYQMTLKKWIFSIGATVSGVPGIANAGGNGVLGMASSGNSLLNAASMYDKLGGLGGMADSVGLGGAYNTVAGWLGNTGMGLTGAGSIGGSTSLASMGLSGGGMGAPVASTALVEAGGAAGSSALSSLASAAPYIAAVLAAIAIGKKLLSYKTVGSGFLGSVTGDEFIGNSYQFKKSSLRGSKTDVSDLPKEINDTFSNAVNAMRTGFDQLGAVTGAGTDVLDSFNYSFRIALADFDEEGKTKEIQRLLSSMSDSMALAFVDNFRTSVDTAQQASSRYWTNTIDGEAGRPNGESNIVSQTRIRSALDPYIEDMLNIFDGYRFAVQGMEGSEGKVSQFATELFTLGGRLAETSGMLETFGEQLDFDKLWVAGKEGETVVDTFARLNTTFAATNAVANMLGQDMSTAFGAIGLASEVARQKVIDLAGGLEPLAAKMAFFSQNFLSEAEQLRPDSQTVAAVFKKYGVAGDITKGDFASLVKGALTDPQKLADLLGIQEPFLRLANYAEKTATALDDAAEKIDDSADTVENANDKFAAALDQVGKAYDAVERSVEAEREKATKAYEAAVEPLTKTIDKLKGLSSVLNSALDRRSLSSQFGSDQAAARAQIATALAIARAGGVLPDADSLSQVLEVIAQPSEQLYATFQEYQRQYIKDSNNIRELAELTDGQLSIEERTLASLEQQHVADMKYYDDMLAFEKAKIDALNGIDTSVQSLSTALAAYGAAIAAAKAVSPTAPGSGIGANSGAFGGAGYGSGAGYGTGTQGGTAQLSAVEALYAKYSDFSYLTAEGGAFWADQFNQGKSIADIEQSFQDSVKAVRGYASGGFHPGGLRLVGENGPELEVTGPSAILSNSMTNDLFSRLRAPASNTSMLEAAILALRGEIVTLRASADRTATAVSAQEAFLRRISPDGNSINVKVAA
ncbi:hypothetical protein [Noviherbaspirillum sp. Root189]|uniref:hypothetical protein n=1 Tax=Noviherbaspirillum sp. Root189 TaxID=1736487 RepID=UPI00070F7455|nr:hypothetical protein [Noviherbaspirillum sp. Root189]KRB73440.1 hypothetical protein ASE07_06200 [Noviherbaspirillum sp. Root189]